MLEHVLSMYKAMGTVSVRKRKGGTEEKRREREHSRKERGKRRRKEGTNEGEGCSRKVREEETKPQ